MPEDPDLPAPVVERTEPVTQRAYLLYVPSAYDASQAWPVVVTCHGTEPFDTARYQINAWAPVAERKGFIAVAPHLAGTAAYTVGSLEAQIEKQRADEEAILAILRHVEAGYRVSPTRVFMTSWSAGSYAALYTGLRHPEVFRALAILQGNFDARLFEDCVGRLDTTQPVFVLTGMADVLIRPQSLALVDWLEAQGMPVFTEERAGTHQRYINSAYEFFERCVREWPLVRIEVAGLAGTTRVRFRAVCDPPAKAYRWEFGDGAVAKTPAPEHAYEQPGAYTVTLYVRLATGRVEKRTASVVVPAP